MKYQVFTTEKAEEDLNSIADYLICKLLAGETAMKQIGRIEQAVMSLEEMPERYHVYDLERSVERKELACNGCRSLSRILHSR